MLTKALKEYKYISELQRLQLLLMLLTLKFIKQRESNFFSSPVGILRVLHGSCSFVIQFFTIDGILDVGALTPETFTLVLSTPFLNSMFSG